VTKLTAKLTSAVSPHLSRRSTALGVGVVITLALAGCGSGADEVGSASSSTSPTSSSSTSSTSSSSTTTSSSPSTPAGRTIEITVTGRTIDPAPSTVRLGVGEKLTLTVTSDHHDELHIHGFDVAKELPAGVAQSVTLTGKDPGVYEVETHHPELRLLKIAVQ
jgi:plastocyanin